jgi:hypothetical protein
VLLEGAAGAGKTTTLAATRALLHARGRGLVVVTPTLKAARIAFLEVGAHTGSAAGLAYQHGWRWSDHGAWTRLALGHVDPATGVPYAGPREAARLGAGDLLVVDEAGMLDQDTARALLTIADEAGARLALLGDRHQLAAVGRGGVLNLAAGQVDPAVHLILNAVHRFTRTDDAGRTTPDTEYAALTLTMRTGDNPGAVFDALVAHDRVRLHPDPAALQEALAATAAAHHRGGERVAVVVDTREQAAELSAAIRERLVVDGRVDDTRVAVTAQGSGSVSGTGSPPGATTATSAWPTATPGPSSPSAATGIWPLSRPRSPRPTPLLLVSPRRGSGCCRSATSPHTSSWPTPAPRTGRKVTPLPQRTWWSASTPAQRRPMSG